MLFVWGRARPSSSRLGQFSCGKKSIAWFFAEPDRTGDEKITPIDEKNVSWYSIFTLCKVFKIVYPM
jgi:hypothetical protein